MGASPRFVQRFSQPSYDPAPYPGVDTTPRTRVGADGRGIAERRGLRCHPVGGIFENLGKEAFI